MAEELQGLLDRIQKENIEKIETEKKRLLEEAKKEADSIVVAAKAQADEIVKKAKTEAEAEIRRAESTIKQASRDILIALKAELLERLRRIVKDNAGTAMTPALMAELIKKMCAQYAAGKEGGLEILLPQSDLDAAGKSLIAALVADLKLRPELSLGSDISAGFKIGFKGEDVFFDFSDDAIADLICEYVGPRLAEIIKS